MNSVFDDDDRARLETRSLRPRFHFAAPCYWMNDPNGLVCLDGVYHLFYQHNPTGNDWGNIHWGHATSQDLVRWTDQPLALYPDPDGLGLVASGSIVVDRRNASGFQTGSRAPLVAIFSHFVSDGRQVQSLAFSNDAGFTWTMFADNPVLEDPSQRDFRDPKVFWHAPDDRWVMLLAANDHIRLYTSFDLKIWAHQQSFGHELGEHAAVWECPDLFELEADGARKWVMLVSVQGGAPNGGSGTQYFIGQFDGTGFEPDPLPYPLWFDHGPDNYAGVSWSDEPDGQRIVIGWMSNWAYADRVPTTGWRGAMTLPRVLRLGRVDGQLRLHNAPVPAMRTLRGPQQPMPTGPQGIVLPDQTVDIEAEFEAVEASGPPFGLRFRSTGRDELSIVYEPANLRLVVDRRACVSGAPFMEQRVFVPVDLAGHTPPRVALRVLLDRSSVEIFVNGGTSSATAVVLPEHPLVHLEPVGRDAALASISVFPLSPA